ncbi:MAG TPA: transglycosylase domain-containing protein [Spirochaetia bacterium]|nr:transglycosylase domain-containing protein [Spirochaetia bacterium]
MPEKESHLTAAIDRSMRLHRPSIRRILLFPFEMLILAHVGIALLIACYTLLFAFVTPRINSLMIFRSLVQGQRLLPIKPVPLSQIPVVDRNMFILLEDGHFYKHHGIDLGAIREAYRLNQRAGYFVRGASTIDQQLARTLFLTMDKNYYRKYLEAFIAVEMDALLKKDRILELYLNSIEWGPGVFGIGQASMYEFGKPFGKLTTDQVRRLAAVLPSPLHYTVNTFMRDQGLYERYLFLVNRQ